MLPIKDNLPHERLPIVACILIVCNVLAFALPARRLALWPMLLDVGSLALLGPSVEGRLGHLRLAALCLLGAALAGALGPLAYAAGGATAAVLLGYLLLFPRARVLSLVAIPFVVTIVEMPAVLLLGAWTGAQLYLGLAG